MRSGVRDISVIIPYYNRELYIAEAVESVLAQTLKPFEILIVNDASQEASRRFLDRYASGCTIIDLPVNVGLAGARNAGIATARGRFIALLDDDDIWLPQKLERQRTYMEEHPECSGVHTGLYVMSLGQPDMYYRRFGPGAMTLAQALTNDYCVIPSTMMFRMEAVQALGGFDPDFRQCEDRDFVIRFCAAGYRIEAIPEPLARYRRQGQYSLTSRRWLIFRTDLKMCWKHRALYLRAYGLRGIVWFVLEKLQEPTFGTWKVYGAVRRLLSLVKMKCRIRPGYQDPVGKQRPPSAQRTMEEATLMGGRS